MNPTLKPWIRWLLNEEATGLLKKEYDVAIERAGRVFNIFRIMSLRPSTMQAAMQLYVSLMQRSSEMLGRPEREMIAVVVSQTNHCHYWTQAHLHDLREEANDDEMVERFAKDWRTTGLPEHTQTALAFAEKLTLTPSHMNQENIKGLRQHGYTDEDIHDIAQIVAYFNYLTRIADGLGIPPEEGLMDPWPREDGQWGTVWLPAKPYLIKGFKA